LKKKRSSKTATRQHQKQIDFNKKKSPADRHRISQFFNVLKDQLYSLRLSFIICLAFGLFGIIATFTISHITKLPFSYLSRDMAAVCNIKVAIGFLSNIGILLWSSTTAICIFTACILKHTGSNSRYSRFFLFSGILTLWLTLDDLFLFHERVFPNYLNIPETYVHGSSACITIVYIAFFFNEIISTDFLLLYTSGFLLAASMSADIFLIFSENETVIEDTLKFSGIIFWLGYFSRTALLHVKSAKDKRLKE